MFASYLEKPARSSFEGQDSDEEILLLLRAHPITNLAWIIPAVLLFLLPFFVPQVALFLGLDIFRLPDPYLVAFLTLNYLLVLVIVFEGFLNWYFNVNIITDRRVIDIDFHSLLFKNIDLAPLRNIEETDSSLGGLFGTFFNFGHVSIQTAGATVAITMRNIPNPPQVADFILDLVDKMKKE